MIVIQKCNKQLLIYKQDNLELTLDAAHTVT
jgi:hypothetical protein